MGRDGAVLVDQPCRDDFGPPCSTSIALGSADNAPLDEDVQFPRKGFRVTQTGVLCARPHDVTDAVQMGKAGLSDATTRPDYPTFRCPDRGRQDIALQTGL